MSRAEKFLEGFKLGSLGAGKIDLAPGAKEDKTHLVIESGTVNPPLGIHIGLPFVYWSESDGWYYFLGVNYAKNKGCNLQLSGGPDLDVNTTNDRKKWGIILRNAQWSVELDTGKKGDISFALVTYKQALSKIEEGGVAGLLRQLASPDILDGKSKFLAWKKEQ